MTSGVQHSENETIPKCSYHIWIYGLQVVRLKENIVLATAVQEKASTHQVIDMLRALGSSRSLLQILHKANLSNYTWHDCNFYYIMGCKKPIIYLFFLPLRFPHFSLACLVGHNNDNNNNPGQS